MIYKSFSKRQKIAMTWWNQPRFAELDGIICDGAVRSGKTVCMTLGFLIWSMTHFNNQNFAICGKTIGSLQRNVISLVPNLVEGLFDVRIKKDKIVITGAGHTNYYFVFGGRDESSYQLVQGMTLAGALLDEVVLMPRSFVEQVLARCSVEDSKFWFNCNPESPSHWFYKEWILKSKEKNVLFLHFTMRDNYSLSNKIIARYESLYSGVFYDRYIKGLWVSADGVVYDMFDKKMHVVPDNIETEGEYFVSCDFGIQNATVFLLWRKEKGTKRWICLNEYYYSGRDNRVQKTVDGLVKGLIEILPTEEFEDIYGETHEELVYPKQVIVDPSATALIVELRKQGFHSLQADNDVMSGISDVSSLLRKNKIAFTSKCKNTIEEFAMYRWDEKASQRGEDKPLKENDHAMDAVRYFVRTRHILRKAG